jgi:hypothetical protein
VFTTIERRAERAIEQRAEQERRDAERRWQWKSVMAEATKRYEEDQRREAIAGRIADAEPEFFEYLNSSGRLSAGVRVQVVVVLMHPPWSGHYQLCVASSEVPSRGLFPFPSVYVRPG